MTAKTILIKINKLRAHEQTSPERVVEVMREIKQTGKIKNPIVVDKKSLVILDGHHRVEVLKKLGCKKAPVMQVDYLSDKVRVYLRREDLLKQLVLEMGRRNKVFPIKTTRHKVKNRVRGVNITLDVLKSADGKEETPLR